MRTIPVHDIDGWRRAARRALEEGVEPAHIMWIDDQSSDRALPGLDVPGDPTSREETSGSLRVPRSFLEKVAVAACHRSTTKWALLYRVLWRLTHESRELLDVVSDPDVRALEQLVAQVRRDEHKMRAFVRFTRIVRDDGEYFVAWYQPDHLIVRMAASFFVDRFGAMRWSILTPDLSAHWDLERLSFTEGVEAPPRLDAEHVESLWRTYYAAVFNPARVNVRATLREMPLRRWARLPEAALIPSLVSSAHERTVALGRSGAALTARAFVPATSGLDELRHASRDCRGCDLFQHATQTVFGEGPSNASLVLVGEQPGDVEDRRGRPFVGPAGEVLDRALSAAGLDRSSLYITNAVKHFAFEQRGKWRIHRTPRVSEMRACRPWLEAELHAIRPRCVVCMGSTAATALLGPHTRVMQARGRIVEHTAWAPALVVTVHPSAVLRADDGERYFELLVSDLRLAAEATMSIPGPPPSSEHA